MNYTIENQFLKVSADDLGGELSSVYSKKTNTEYLWQRDEKYWTGSACNLFPICGRLTDGKYVYNGREYTLAIHGCLHPYGKISSGN